MALANNTFKISLTVYMWILCWCINTIAAQPAGEPFDQDYWKELSKTVYSQEKMPQIQETSSPAPVVLPNQFTGILRYAFYIMIAAVLIVILFGILRQKYGDGGSKKTRKEHRISDVDDEFTPDPLLRERYHEALLKQDYRSALRYIHLILLRHLASENKIVLQKGKTNHHYLRELNLTSPETSLVSLTNAVEKAWFGNRMPDSATFQRVVSPWSHLTQPNQGGVR